MNTIPNAPESPDLQGQNAELIEEPLNLMLILQDSTKDQEKMKKKTSIKVKFNEEIKKECLTLRRFEECRGEKFQSHRERFKRNRKKP